jgi:hypothetical protein
VLCTQAQGLAVNGSYAYVAAFGSNALVVVDVSNPASPVIRGSVVSSSLMNGVCDPGLRAWLASGAALHPHRLSCSHPRRHRLLKLSRALTRSLARSRVLCTQPQGLAMSGSYAYVAGQYSNSLVVIDVSNPASPVIRGSVVSSLLGGVRVRPGASRADDLGRRGMRPPRPSRSHVRGATAIDTLSRSHALALTCCAHSLMTSL